MSIKKIRKGLEKVRKKFVRDVENTSNSLEISKIYKRYSLCIDSIIIKINNKIIKELGTPPCYYSLFAMGSYGKMEISIFSDLDYGILIENKKYKRFFIKYGKLMGKYLDSIDFYKKDKMHVCNEFSPTGNFGKIFVNTPKKMLKIMFGLSNKIKSFCLRDSSFIQSALIFSRLIYERGNLFSKFCKKRDKLLNKKKNRFPLFQKSIVGMRSPFELPYEFNYWKNVRLEEIPQTGNLKKGKINIKHDILRIIQISLQGLKIFYRIKSISSYHIFRKIFNKKASKKIRKFYFQCLKYILLNDYRCQKREKFLHPVFFKKFSLIVSSNLKNIKKINKKILKINKKNESPMR